MSLESVKSVVARMSRDSSFKQMVGTSPEEALSQYDLTTPEREAISKFGLGITGPQTGAGPLDTWV